MLKHTYLEREQGVLLKENAVNLGNTEMQILTRPVPATTVIARLSEILRAFCIALLRTLCPVYVQVSQKK